jgi:hypothetical protein
MSNQRNFTNVYIWQYFPRDWRCHEIASGLTAIGATREEALEVFVKDWAERAPFTLLERAPKIYPKPPGNAEPPSAKAG